MVQKLALNGGEKIAGELSNVSWPRFDSKDENAVLEALRNKYWGGIGDKNLPNTIFEKEYSKYHDSEYGVVVANGTVSLELALRAGGIKPGDEVLVPAITFIASASAIVSVGAVPRFIDVKSDTCQIDAEKIKEAINPKTKAIIIVHYGGYMADLDDILPAAKKNNLLVIEDCAHAQGASWRGEKAGSFGTFGSFSFQQSKALPAGEGGIVITSDDNLFKRAQLLRNIGRKTGQTSYNHYISASNWRLGGLQGALLLSQFKKFIEYVDKRNQNGNFLEEELDKIPGIDRLPPDERMIRGYYFIVIKFNKQIFGCSREKFIKALNAEGVTGVGHGYARPLYKEPAFKLKNLRSLLYSDIKIPDYTHLNLSASEKWADQQVTIPHYYILENKKRIKLIIDAIKKIKDNVDELK